MPQLKRIDDGALFTVPQDPVWVAGVWECGDQRFTDPERDIFEVPAPDLVVDRETFYALFTIDEEAAARASTDAGLSVLLRRLDSATNVNLSLKSTQDGIDYMTTVKRADGVTPVLDPSRVSAILSATPPA